MKEKQKKDSFLSWVGALITAILLAVFIRTFIFSATVVIGESMNPTLVEHDRLIALKVPLYYRGPQRGDIVILQSPVEEHTEYVKRVVGLPGEEISIHDGKVYINGKVYEESYTSSPQTQIYNQSDWKLKQDEYFLMGDNRLPGKSLDSRYFGPVKKSAIDGIIKIRYWPLNRITGGTFE